jgi:hypothetical protein
LYIDCTNFLLPVGSGQDFLESYRGGIEWEYQPKRRDWFQVSYFVSSSLVVSEGETLIPYLLPRHGYCIDRLLQLH